MKYTTILGIDISKLTFDVATKEGEHSKFDNTLEGFTIFSNTIAKDTLCVMEVTGIYHLELARFLYHNNIAVSVVNPLSVKRFIQMHLKRNKTDKADAAMIALYATVNQVKPWVVNDEILEKSNDYYRVMEQLISTRASFKNVLDALKAKKSAVELIQNVKLQVQNLTQEIKKIELQLIEFIKQYDSSLLTNLKSIKGIGVRTALVLIITTKGFENFESAKQLASYFGIAPTEKVSGTSVNGSRKISKMGNPLVRKKLFMCSLQAFRFNKSCSQLYHRLLNKGKSKKLALIAVSNKLLKIAFAIAKSGLPYDENYKSVNTKIY